MKELIIKNSNNNSYRVYIDSTYDKLHNLLEENRVHDKDKLFLITDDFIFNIYKETLEKFKQKYKCNIFYFPNGDRNKNINTVQNIYNFLFQNGADRKSILIAFGGRVVGDMTGFVASTFMRGIRYINIPTTLISQTDSCIGGKNGYNYNGVKNAIGSFYDPSFVYVCINYLKTLSSEEFINEFGEVVKYGAIKREMLLQYISDNYRQILEKENDKLLYLVKECLSIKAEIIEEDYNDYGIRNILNFGHTIAHGIEMDSSNRVHHGKAVALGILVALKLSQRKLNMPYSNYNKMKDIYLKMGLPVKYKIENMDAFMDAINCDKKNIGNINMVLLEDFEKCRIKVSVSYDEIVKAIHDSIEKGE